MLETKPGRSVRLARLGPSGGSLIGHRKLHDARWSVAHYKLTGSGPPQRDFPCHGHQRFRLYR